MIFKRKKKTEQATEEATNTLTKVSEESLYRAIVAALRTIYDPEIPVNIYDLGLIYAIDIDNQQNVNIKMTLTAPGCPVAGTFPGMVEDAVRHLDSVNEASVELIWEPPWSQDKMSEAAKLQLGML